MNRPAKMRRKPVAATGRRGRERDPENGHPRSLLQRFIARGGGAVFGVLPGFRHVRAANDPEA